ncbi:MAG: hypothetical protein IPH51_17890 [Rubrivivax sp.]|nr:hypothetical protein [Rubrivivax sp.]
MNFDAEVFDLKSTTEDRLFGRFSYGRYGVRAGLPRLMALLARRGISPLCSLPQATPSDTPMPCARCTTPAMRSPRGAWT